VRPTATLLLLALAAWLATLTAAGASAMAAFTSLPKMGVSVAGTEEFFAADTSEMGRYAAGRMLAPVFMTSDWVQFACSALAVGCTVRMARLGAFGGHRLARLALFAAVGTAALLLAFHAWRAPAMNADLLAYWQAIAAGDRDAAAAAKASFDGAHRIADGGFRATLVAVLVALAAFPAALLPGTKARHGS
jgi:hypothetical protein